MENESEDQNNTVTLNISEIEPNKDQPRMDFDDESLAELAESISKHGILQPLLVRPLLYGGYQIVAGERRYRASRMAGLTEVPVVIRELDDKETMEIALIENLQRENLTPVEEAKGYKTLMDTYGFTQEQVSESVGRVDRQLLTRYDYLTCRKKYLSYLLTVEFPVVMQEHYYP